MGNPAKVYRTIPGKPRQFFREFRTSRAAMLFIAGQPAGMFTVEDPDEQRIAELESEGLTRSDAQAAFEAEKARRS